MGKSRKSRDSLFSKNPFLDTFKLVFVGMFGAISAYAIIALYSALFVGTGYYVVMKYNKDRTKPLEDLQTGQYFGLVLAFLGMLPWLQYFFMSFAMEGGSYAFDSMMGSD
tara:strand:+ start:98 stop:427 length:330 start_codon:yes stop_codon:yes gene_type:complete